jgi:hypothetical protein
MKRMNKMSRMSITPIGRQDILVKNGYKDYPKPSQNIPNGNTESFPNFFSFHSLLYLFSQNGFTICNLRF